MTGNIGWPGKFFLISQIPLFSGLSWLERRAIASRASVAEYKKGQILYRQSSSADALYCLASGRVEVFVDGDERFQERLERLSRGACFGMISILTGDTHSVSVKAVNDSVVLRIPKEDFTSLLKSMPKLSLSMSQALSRRLKRKDIHRKTIFESTIISIYSGMAGTGRSTYASGLAAAISNETGKSLILVDFRPGGADVAGPMVDYGKIICSIARTNGRVNKLSIRYDIRKGLKIGHITPLLTYLVADYHYIVLDLPSHLDESIFKALTQSDMIHIIVNPYREALLSARGLLDRIERSIPESAPKIRIISNQLKRGGSLDYEGCCSILKTGIYATMPFIKDEHRGEYARMVRRVARDIGGVKVGLALGGGAALGLIHVGILKVLEREKIPVDIVAGSSMGAMIAALWATGMDAVRIEKLFAGFKSRLSIMMLARPIIPRSGLIGSSRIEGLLKDYLGDKTFRDVRIPLKVTACDIDRRKTVAVEKGRIRDAVRASISIPGMFKPVRYEKGFLIDGGILEPVPVDTLIKANAAKIIASNPLPSPEDMFEKVRRAGKKKRPPNIFNVILSTIQGMEYEVSEALCSQADVSIHPAMPGLEWHEFHRALEFVEIGEKEAERLLPDIKKMIEE